MPSIIAGLEWSQTFQPRREGFQPFPPYKTDTVSHSRYAPGPLEAVDTQNAPQATLLPHRSAITWQFFLLTAFSASMS
jgi:hypothetical protein